MSKLKIVLVTAAFIAAIPASAATVVTYQIQATLTETRTANYDRPDEKVDVICYGPAVYDFSFDSDTPHEELYGDYLYYGMFATVYGSTLSLNSRYYPGYGGLTINLFYDHDLGNKLPVGDHPTSVSWFENNVSANFSTIVVGTDVRLLAVPEPSTWALMLVGFGMIGFAARRRSTIKTTVTFA